MGNKLKGGLWKSSGHRSKVQKSQLAKINNGRRLNNDRDRMDAESDKENAPPGHTVIPSGSDTSLKRYRNERKVSGRLRSVLEESRMLHRAEVTAHELTTEDLSESLEKMDGVCESVKQCNQVLKKENHNLKLKVSRFPSQQANAVSKAVDKTRAESRTMELKQKGVVMDGTRDMCLQLVTEGVPAVGWVTEEGGIAAEVQIMVNVQTAKSITFSGDGTTHKHVNYESRHVNCIQPSGDKQCLYLGVHSAINHKSETQLAGLQDQVQDLCTTYKSFRGGKGITAETEDFASKLRGANTDHAVDQKKLRGKDAEVDMPPEYMVSLVLEATKLAIDEIGGPNAWEALPQAARIARNKNTQADIYRKIGEEEFQKLSPEQQEAIDLFIWVGCCMHKELNTFKSGYIGMSTWWETNAVELGNEATKARSGEVSEGGAVKLTSLAGAIFDTKTRRKDNRTHSGILWKIPMATLSLFQTPVTPVMDRMEMYNGVGSTSVW
ncbi:hypothetical protein M422DRAFT_250782 [Sphaerobolus stellatus SS14]|uniref:Uncharacterized protein n=1 Tax=Sphaerobolus stellatus (strain SS14) TaxID=990650 RepID=A0A0C9VEP8_SPHS4|nr:hypothetical protein M422DRAFT_250782 [Sphaerobolus stellatus SS14]